MHAELSSSEDQDEVRRTRGVDVPCKTKDRQRIRRAYIARSQEVAVATMSSTKAVAEGTDPTTVKSLPREATVIATSSATLTAAPSTQRPASTPNGGGFSALNIGGKVAPLERVSVNQSSHRMTRSSGSDASPAKLIAIGSSNGAPPAVIESPLPSPGNNLVMADTRTADFLCRYRFMIKFVMQSGVSTYVIVWSTLLASQASQGSKEEAQLCDGLKFDQTPFR